MIGDRGVRHGGCGLNPRCSTEFNRSFHLRILALGTELRVLKRPALGALVPGMWVLLYPALGSPVPLAVPKTHWDFYADFYAFSLDHVTSNLLNKKTQLPVGHLFSPHSSGTPHRGPYRTGRNWGCLGN